jgi:hypothetical protein
MPTTNIEGYDVELELNVDVGDGPTTQCRVSTKRGSVEYSSSLAALMQTGVLDDSVERDIAVPEQTIDKIVQWAVRHGY